MSLSSLKLKVYLLGFLGLLQAPYRVTGFIWHGNAHYVAYLVSGYQWYCLNDAVVSEVDVGDLPSQALYDFLGEGSAPDTEGYRSWPQTS